MLDDAGRLIFGTCGCAFFKENVLNKGPCEHMVALLVASEPRPAHSAALTTLAVTLLNPHVYLDTLVMLGTVTNSFGHLRWVAAAGAMAASAVWFSLLGVGARALSGVLDRPATWRVIDGLVGVVMIGIAIRLAVG